LNLQIRTETLLTVHHSKLDSFVETRSKWIAELQSCDDILTLTDYYLDW